MNCWRCGGRDGTAEGFPGLGMVHKPWCSKPGGCTHCGWTPHRWWCSDAHDYQWTPHPMGYAVVAS